jgi:hypothetical protein
MYKFFLLIALGAFGPCLAQAETAPKPRPIPSAEQDLGWLNRYLDAHAAGSRRAPPQVGPDQELAQTAAALSYRYAKVELANAHAALNLPSRFRFVPGNRLHRLARLRGQPLDVSVLGWVSHESVDLGQPSAWALEVRFYETGTLAEGGDPTLELDFAAQVAALGGAPSLEGGGRSLGNGAFAPQWDAARGLLTWSLEDPEGRSEHFALRPTRHGALLFRLPSLEPDQREFGLRATRLLAASVEVDSEWRWRGVARPGEATAPLTLLQWVQGRRPTGPSTGASVTGTP